MSDNYSIENEVVSRLLSELHLVHQFFDNTPNLGALKDLASELSSYLPQVSDSTVIAIDDIIYRSDDIKAGTRVVSETSIKHLYENSYQVFYDAIFKHRVSNSKIEQVFLQLLELLPNDFFVKPQFEKAVKTMMRYSHCIRTEQQLKVMKVMVGKHGGAIKFHVADSASERFSYLCHTVAHLWMLRLTDESDYEHPDKKRWASWISEISTIILEKLPFGKIDLKFPLIEYIETCKHQKEDLYNQEFAGIALYFHTLIKYSSKYLNAKRPDPAKSLTYSALVINHLYKHFMSAKDKIQRIGRVQSFVKGFHRVLRIPNHGLLGSSREENQDIFTRFVNYSDFMIYEICKLFHVLKRCPSVKLTRLASRSSYDIGPWTYLPRDVLSSSSYPTFKEETARLMNTYFKSPNNFENFEISEESSEKKSVHCFHKFMKRLQLLDIFYTIWLMFEDDVIVEGLSPPGFIDTIFIHNEKAHPIKEIIKKFLIKPRKRRRIHFALQVLLRKCPFLVFPHRCDICHMENLIKMLSGRKISKVSEERLYCGIVDEYEKMERLQHCTAPLVELA